MNHETTWARLQDELNRCEECRRLGAGLFPTAEASPARPPEPPGEPLLFISEAPPPTGGFWCSTAEDALRDSLHRILDDSDAQLPATGAQAWLDEFVRRGFFLVQAVKWPLLQSARNFSPTERRLIEHSTARYLLPELEAIQPRSAVLLGKVACYALGQLFQAQGFDFRSSSRLEEVRGRHFQVRLRGRPLDLYPAGLRHWADFDRIRAEVNVALWRHRDPQLSEIVRRLTAAYHPEQIYLFGSRARGETGPDSDYDLLVVVPDSAPSDQQRSRLAYAALRGTGVAADVLVCSRGYFESRRQLPASLPATVMREGRSLYAA